MVFEATFVYFDNIKAEVIRKINIDGHEVTWVKSTSIKSESNPNGGWFEYQLWCECDLKNVLSKQRSRGLEESDSYQCKYKFAACELRRYEIIKELKGIPEFDWSPGIRKKSLKTIIVNLFERSQNHEWLGTFHDELHGFDLVRMLGVDYSELWTAVNSLTRDGKLASVTGKLVLWEARWKKKKPIFPYLRERIDATFSFKVLSPISGFEPLEWFIEVRKYGRVVQEVRVPIRIEPEWTGTGGKFHDADIARLQERLAELRDSIWEDERKGKFDHVKSRRKAQDF